MLQAEMSARGLASDSRNARSQRWGSPRRWIRGFRRTDLMRLVAYGAQYHVLEDERLLPPSDLTLALVVPARGGALDKEIARMGFRLTWLGGGYGRLDGGVYTEAALSRAVKRRQFD